MKYLLIVAILTLGVITESTAQKTSKAFNIQELRTVVGTEKNEVRVLFVGNDVTNRLEESKRVSDWGKLRAKTDVFIVFSEEAEKTLKQKVNKNVVLARDYSQFFKSTWRDYDHLTWVKLNSKGVVFVETVGRDEPKTEEKKPDYVQAESDTRIAEYISGAFKTEGETAALVFGEKITVSGSDTLVREDDFKVVDRYIDFVIVYSNDLKNAMSNKTSKPVVAMDKTISEACNTSLDMNWTVIRANGSDLGKVLGTGQKPLEKMANLLSERGTLQ